MTVLCTTNKNGDILGSTLTSGYHPLFYRNNNQVIIEGITYTVNETSMATEASSGVFWAFIRLTAIHNRN